MSHEYQLTMPHLNALKIYADSLEILRSIAKSGNFTHTTLSQAIMDINRAYDADNYDDDNGNTLLHHAIIFNDLHEIQMILKQQNMHFICSDIVNDSNDNLLHVACEFDRDGYFDGLIETDPAMLRRHNRQCNTPIHIALSNDSHRCLLKFEDLLKREHYFEGKLLRILKYLFEIYDLEGHTILHKAILHNQYELVGEMLRFCVRNNIDACDIEVLGKGDTILHLAVNNDLPEMTALVKHIIPMSIYYENYAGDTATIPWRENARG